MALQVNPFNQAVTTRLLDFFGNGTPWTRRLWGAGTSLMLRELIETVDAVAQGTLSDASARWLANSMKSHVGPDPGVGETRKALLDILSGKDPLRAGGHDYSCLVELAGTIEADYLSRWATAVRQGPTEGEMAARRVASFMLDAGFSPDFLHRWWTRRIFGDHGTVATLADVIDDAHTLVRGAPGRFRVLVAFTAGVPLTPPQSLRSIQDDAAEALRRLYRARNLVVHGARTRGVAVGTALRTAAPLVGEGLDRIAHAWIVDGVEPRILVARAHVRLDALRGGASLPLTRMLE